MRFDLIVLALSALTIVACGSSTEAGNSSKKYTVGREPQSFGASYLWQGGDPNLVVAVDRDGQTVQQFSLEPFAHIRTIPLALSFKDQGVISSSDGSYFVTTGESEYAIQGIDGSIERSPEELGGTISSVAFDPVQNLLVISDEFQTMALLELDGVGNVARSKKAGSLFPDNRVVLAGTMMSSGRLALSLAKTTLAIVDVRATIASPTWVYTSFEIPEATDMSWIAALPQQPNTLLVQDGNRLLVIDATSGTVMDQRDLEKSQIVGRFRDYDPHMIIQTEGNFYSDLIEVLFVGADMKIASRSMRGSNDQLRQSWLDSRPGIETLTASFDPDRNNDVYTYSEKIDPTNVYRRQEIYRFRLTDNAAIDRTTIETPVDAAVTPSNVFLMYKSTLGLAERRNYGKSPATVRLEGYNLQSLIGKYRK